MPPRLARWRARSLASSTLLPRGKPGCSGMCGAATGHGVPGANVHPVCMRTPLMIATLACLSSVVSAQPHVDVPPARQTPKTARDRPLEVSGAVQYTKPIRENKIVFLAGTVVTCAPGLPLRIEADIIEWKGNVAFRCSGADGATGAAGTDQGGWCVGEDQGNARANFDAGGREPGGDGGNGGNGIDGSDVTIIANNHVFIGHPSITIETRGGHGGARGRGGYGRHSCMAPSGDDCAHGTNLHSCKDAPQGLAGYSGYDGHDGRPEMRGVANTGKAKLVVNSQVMEIADRIDSK